MQTLLSSCEMAEALCVAVLKNKEMMQLGIVVSLPAFVWNPYLTLGHVTLALTFDL